MPDEEDTSSPDDIERTLLARARLLAQVPVEPQQGGTIEVIEFLLAHERYAFEAGSVHEVRPLEELTPLPCTPAFYLGLVNARGRLVPVIDLKKFFDLPVDGIGDLHRVVFLRNDQTQLGVLADAVEGARRVALDSIQPSLPTLTGIGAEYLRGVTAERLVILDASAVLEDPRLVVDEEVDP
jgi:purine-binding chemotaxis protein CheW